MALPLHANDPFAAAVVDDDPKLRTRLAMQLGESARAAAFASLDGLDARIADGRPLVVVAGPSYAERLADLGRLVRGRPHLAAVLVATELTTELLQQAIRAGVDDVVALGAAAVQLPEAVARAGEDLGTITPAPRPPEAPATPGGKARVVTTFSTKGGAGKSFVATNLAVALARRSERPVAIVDLDLQFGDVAVLLGIAPEQTIADAVGSIDRLDEALLRSLLVRHEPSGLLVLPAPLEPAAADAITLGHVTRILEVLSGFCGHVVIDTPAQFNDIVLGMLESSDDIVLLAGMEIPAIKNTKVCLQTLRLLHIPSTKVTFLLNRANSKVRLTVADVERTLQMKADCLLPSDIAVPQSINKGVPLVLDSPRSAVSRNLERLADRFPAAEAATAG